MLLSMDPMHQPGQTSPGSTRSTNHPSIKSFTQPVLTATANTNPFQNGGSTLVNATSPGFTPSTSNSTNMTVSFPMSAQSHPRCSSMPLVSRPTQHLHAAFKRSRDQEIAAALAIQVPQQPSMPKKKRGNSYVAQREVPTTFTSQIGSLAMVQPSSNSSFHSVPLRRQLSSSKIESFLSNDQDSMDMDTEATRPRSMSF